MKISGLGFVLFNIAASAWAAPASENLDHIVTIQRAQIIELQNQIKELKQSINTVKTAAATAQTTATTAQTAADSAKTKASDAATAADTAQRAANEAQKTADARIRCGSTVSIRTSNPGVPSNKGWLLVTDTTVASGNMVPGWGYNTIFCN